MNENKLPQQPAHLFLFRSGIVTLGHMKANRVKHAIRVSICLASIIGFGGCVGFDGLVRKTGPKYEAEIQ